MPRLPIDYNNTIMYKLVCRNLAIKNCYVGHTTNFTNRKRLHKSGCKTREYYLYQFIQENGDWENWDMIMVEQYPCNNLYEASARERHWIETLNADLNHRLPPTGLSKNEVYKQYYRKNIKKIAEQAKQYRIENADKNKEMQKQWRTENAEKHKEQQKQWCSTQYCCILCHKQMRRDNLNKHYSKIHNIST